MAKVKYYAKENRKTGTHLCKSMRGVKSQGEMTVSVLTGIFKENGEARREFYKLIDAQKR